MLQVYNGDGIASFEPSQDQARRQKMSIWSWTYICAIGRNDNSLEFISQHEDDRSLQLVGKQYNPKRHAYTC